MRIKRLKPGMLFTNPVTSDTKVSVLLVKRNGSSWTVWIMAVEKGKTTTPYFYDVPGKAIREEWIDKYNYELHE